MSRFVVDASVAVKWFVPEVHSIAALRLLARGQELMAPELIFPEVSNVLWKKRQRDEIDADAALALLRDFWRLPLKIVQADFDLLHGAWHIAEQFNRTFYDSLYVALAVKAECRMVTADLKFYNSLKPTALSHAMVWVEDI